MQTKTFPNGVIGNYTYFDNGDLKTLTYTSGTATPLLALSYSYDNASNIDSKTKDGVLYDYSYDNLYQLTGVTIPSATSQNESFSYDGVGNRLTSIDEPDWNYNNNNQLLRYNGVSFGYDDNGNTISKADTSGTTLYNYSIDDRLLTVTTPTVSASYQYDPMGRRIRKTVNGITISYLWDQDVLLAELDDSGNIVKSYLYNPDNNEPISSTESGNSYWYLNDHLMTPQKMVDSSEAVVWSADYKAFGEVAVEPSSTITNNLRFPGQYQDLETNLYYNYHRYYDSDTGRYLTTDVVNLTSFQIDELGIKQIALFTHGELLSPAKLKNMNTFLNIGLIDFQYRLLLHDPIFQNSYIYSRQNTLKYIDPKGKFEPGTAIVITGLLTGLTVAGLYLHCTFKCFGCTPPACKPIQTDIGELQKFKNRVSECTKLCWAIPVHFGADFFTAAAAAAGIEVSGGHKYCE